VAKNIDTNRVPFINTYIDSLTTLEAKQVIDDLIQQGGAHYVVTPNSDIVVKMQDDPELKLICDNADLILADGQIIVMLSRYLGHPIKERVCMTDFVWQVIDLAVEKDYKIFMLGGKEESLKKAIRIICEKEPTLKIVDFYSPPLGFEHNKYELSAINKRIKSSEADILVVFLGCPKQEKFIYNNKNEYQVPVSITMGGCVDFIAGNVRRAPVWMQKIGLEWFFRFLQEPQRLFRRYFVDDMKIFKLAQKNKKNSI